MLQNNENCIVKRALKSVLFNFLIICNIYAFPQFKNNDAFILFSWTRKKSDTQNYGNRLVTVIDSQVYKNNALFLGTKVRVDGLPQWAQYIKDTYGSLEISFTNSKPMSIVNCSPTLNHCPWLTEFKLYMDNERATIRFPFPVPDNDDSFRKYDFFTISINDSVHLQFQCVQDTIFMGSFLNIFRKNEPQKWLIAKGAIMVRTSKKAPFKIHNIEMNAKYKSLINSFIGFDLSRFSTDCDYYGVDFIDTTRVSNLISISNVTITDTDTLKTGSTYSISWKTENQEIVNTCSLYIRFNYDIRWVPLGKVTGRSTQYSWLVPKQNADSCIIMVRAIAQDGQRASNVSKYYVIAESSGKPPIDTVVNTFCLTASADTSIIKLVWKSIAAIPSEAESIGIFSCSFHYPIEYNDPDASLIRLFPAADSSYLFSSIKPGQNLYFALMVKDTSGNWSKPTEQSITSARLIEKGSTFNIVQITPGDTQHLFQDSLRIWSLSGSTIIDTIETWTGPVNGFVIVSKGYFFRNGKKISGPVWINASFDKTIKSTEAAKALLYHYDIYEGGWMLSMDSVRVDTVNNNVSAKNAIPEFPFIFLIDTLPPVIKYIGEKKLVKSGQMIYDTITVNDNIKNYKYNFFAGPGDEEPGDLSLYVSPVDSFNSLQILSIITPPGIADGCTGIRSLFTVSDGVHEASINLSRGIIRDSGNCDNCTTSALQWVPVMVSSKPDYSDFKSVMNYSTGLKNWVYNTKEMRVIKWIDGHPKAYSGGWVEYGTVADTFFTFNPGSILWIKTKNRLGIDFGSAVVPPLGDSSKITIPPGQWVDFSSPYPFDVYLRNILEATKIKTHKNLADSLEIYSWIEYKGSFQTTPIYLPAMPGLSKPDDTIKSMKPYTIYNPAKLPVDLQIPPTCIAASSLLKMQMVSENKNLNSGQWSIGIISWDSDGCALPIVYLGQNSSFSKEITYQISPSFSNVRMTVHDSQNRANWGSIVSPQKSESGNYFELSFENNESSSEHVRVAIENLYGIDRSHLFKWYEPDHDAWIDAKDTFEVLLNSRQKKVFIFATGTEQYFSELNSVVRKNVLSLRTVYPNPFSRALSIQYSLPYGVQRVSFLMYDLMGRVLWNKDISDIKPGPSTLRMKKLLATGMYVVQMRVKIEGAESLRILNRAVMCVR